MSKSALWATSTLPGAPAPAHAAKRGYTAWTGSAPATMSVVIPVIFSMNGGIGALGRTSSSNSSTTWVPRMRSAPISVISHARPSPVVSTSTTSQSARSKGVPRPSSAGGRAPSRRRARARASSARPRGPGSEGDRLSVRLSMRPPFVIE